MKRRSFVKNIGLASLTSPFVVNNISFQAITKKLFDIEKSSDDHVLVIIRLNGGNDGLNTVFPIDQYDNLLKLLTMNGKAPLALLSKCLHQLNEW